MITLQNNIFASTYGSNAYNSGTYNGATTTTTGGGGSASSGSAGGGLSDTGIAIAGIVTIAAIILLVAMAVRIWKRPNKASTDQ